MFRAVDGPLFSFLTKLTIGIDISKEPLVLLLAGLAKRTGMNVARLVCDRDSQMVQYMSTTVWDSHAGRHELRYL